MKNFKIISLTLLTALSYNHITHSIHDSDTFFDRDMLIEENYNDDANVVIQSLEETNAPAEKLEADAPQQVIESTEVVDSIEEPQKENESPAELKNNVLAENSIVAEKSTESVQQNAEEQIASSPEQAVDGIEEVSEQEKLAEIQITPPVVTVEPTAHENTPADIAQEVSIHEDVAAQTVEKNSAIEEKSISSIEDSSSHTEKIPVDTDQTKVVKVYPVLDAARIGLKNIKSAAQSMIDYVYDFFEKK